MFQKTKNIIFDLGNVLIDLHPETSASCMESLLGVPYDMYHVKGPACFAEFEAGTISEAQFQEALSAISGRAISRMALLECWNALLGEMPLHRVDLLVYLQKKYRLFLLSNTNAIHIAYVRAYFEQQNIAFWDLFECVYLSHEIGLRKPDPRVFTYVLETAGIRADESLFIDDGPMHVYAAEQVGIPSVCHDPREDVGMLLKRLQLIP